MFFNEDILYRNGPLALVWVAGNDAFKTKKGRSRKHLNSCLQSNLTALCGTLRSLFPQMGTAHGIPIKKMGILAQGLGAIYYLKLENFARDVTQALLASKRPFHLTVDILPPKKGTAKRNAKALELPLNEGAEGIQFGEEDYLNLYGFGQDLDNVGVFPSPRRLDFVSISPRRSNAGFDRIEATPVREIEPAQRSARKRKRGEQEEEEDILRRLHDTAVAADPRAHLMVEEDPVFLRPDAPEDRDLEFGDGMELLNGMDVGAGYGEQDQGPLLPADPELPTGFDDQTTRMGPPTNIEDETRSRSHETPTGAEPERENGRKRRNLGKEPNGTVMELPAIEEEEGRRRKLKAVRRRLRVDAKIAITIPDLNDGIERNKAASTYAALEERLDQARAPPKSAWKLFATRTPANMFAAPGRSCGSCLTELWDDRIRKLKAAPPRIEAPRSGEGNASRSMDGNLVSVISGAGGRSVQEMGVGGPVGDEDNRPGVSTVAGEASSREVIEGPSPPIIDAAQEAGPAFDDGFGAQFSFPPAAEEYQGEMAPCEEPFPVREERPSRRKSRGDDEAAQTALAKKLDAGKTFEELYPPEKCGKEQVARSFLQMLKMQSKRTICLRQEECFGEIRVEKLPLAQ